MAQQTKPPDSALPEQAPQQAAEFLPYLRAKVAELKKLELQLPQIRGAPENRQTIEAYFFTAYEAARRMETIYADLAKGKRPDMAGLLENIAIFDRNANAAVKLMGVARGFQGALDKAGREGRQNIAEAVAAVKEYAPAGNERDGKLKQLTDARQRLEDGLLKLGEYRLMELVQVQENGTILLREDAPVFQRLNTLAAPWAYGIAWQELIHKWDAEGSREKNPERLQRLAVVALAGVRAQMDMLLHYTTVPVTDRFGNPLRDETGRQKVRKLLPQGTELDLYNQLSAVQEQVEKAQGQLGANMTLTARRALLKAAKASRKANEEMGEVVGKHMNDYIRAEQDKLGLRPKKDPLENVGYWLKSRGERYGEYAADMAVIGIGAVAAVTGVATLPVLAAEAAYWSFRGTQAIYHDYQARGAVSAAGMASGIAMMIPGMGGMGLKLVEAGAMRTAIELTTVTGSTYLLGSGAYSMLHAGMAAGRYGATGTDIEAMVGGALMMGLGAKGNAIAANLVPKPTAKKQPAKIIPLRRRLTRDEDAVWQKRRSELGAVSKDLRRSEDAERLETLIQGASKETNPSEAAKTYERAADLADKIGDQQRAAYLYEKAAKKYEQGGELDRAGGMYLHAGKLAYLWDVSKGDALLRKAAELNQTKLSLMYEAAASMTRDIKTSIPLYERAAELSAKEGDFLHACSLLNQLGGYLKEDGLRSLAAPVYAKAAYYIIKYEGIVPSTSRLTPGELYWQAILYDAANAAKTREQALQTLVQTAQEYAQRKYFDRAGDLFSTAADLLRSLDEHGVPDRLNHRYIDPDRALTFYRNAIELFKKANDDERVASASREAARVQ